MPIVAIAITKTAAARVPKANIRVYERARVSSISLADGAACPR